MKTTIMQRLWTAAMALVLLPVVAAATPASLSVEDFTIAAGETKEILIDLNNPSDEITLVQFDLRLPAGLSIAMEDGEMAIDIAGRTTWKKHSLSANGVNGLTRFLLASNTNAVISGTSGAVISIKITASSTFSGGDIKLENQLLVTPNAHEIKPADYTYTVNGEVATPASLSIEEFTMSAGETREILIDLNNPSDEITLVQFDLHLPAGLSIAMEDGEMAIDIAGRTTWKKHSLSANGVNGLTRFLLASNTNAVISGTSGAVISIKITASSTFSGGDIKLENQLLVTPSAHETKPANYTYTVVVEDNPHQPIDITGATLTLESVSSVYTGIPITPACEVMLNDQRLVADIDYIITCTDNVNVGTAKVIATGIGNYTGTVVATFTISKAMLTINADKLTKVYGEENPDLTYAISGFVNDEDASVLTALPVLNTDARTDSPVGKYRIKVSGGEARNYEFTYRDAVLTVMPRNLSDATVTLDAENYAYTGKCILPVVTVKCGSVVLVENTDYSLSATNDVEPGTATLRIKGWGNYTGTIDTTFVIYLKPSVEVIINGFTIDPILYELQRCSAPALFEAEQGTVEVDNYYALAGNIVCLSITPKSAYYVSKEDITGVDLVDNDPSDLRETRHYRYIVPKSGLVTIRVTFMQFVDGINSVDGDDDAAFDVYDLSGRKVRRHATTLNDLPKGVYVIGGRKQVVR